MALKDPGSFEWKVLYAVTGIIDIIQWVVDCVIGAGELANEIASPIIGSLIGLYFQLRGVSMVKRISRLISLIGGYVAEATTLSVAPAWIVDVWLIHNTVKDEWAKEQEGIEEDEEEQENQPANRLVGGKMMRVPPRLQPSNEDGVRAANDRATINPRVGGDIRPKQGTKSVGQSQEKKETSLAA